MTPELFRRRLALIELIPNDCDRACQLDELRDFAETGHLNAVDLDDLSNMLEKYGMACPNAPSANPLRAGESLVLLYDHDRKVGEVRTLAIGRTRDSASSRFTMSHDTLKALDQARDGLRRALRSEGRDEELVAHTLELRDQPRSQSRREEIDGASLGLSACVALVSRALSKAPDADVVTSAVVRDDGTLAGVRYLDEKLTAVSQRFPSVRRIVVAVEQECTRGDLEIVRCQTVAEALAACGLPLSDVPAPATSEEVRWELETLSITDFGWICGVWRSVFGVLESDFWDILFLHEEQPVDQFRILIELIELVWTANIVQDDCLSEAHPTEWMVMQGPLNLGQLLDEAAQRKWQFDRRVRALIENVAESKRTLAYGQRSVSPEDLTACAGLLRASLEDALESAHSFREWGTCDDMLEPVISKMWDGRWAILIRRDGIARYVALDLSRAVYEPTREAIAWIYTADPSVDVLPRVEALNLRKPFSAIRRAARDRLLGMQFGGELKSNPTGVRGGFRFADFMARTTDGRPLLTVKCVLTLEMPTLRQELLLTALALKTPFAAVTDGARWQWFRCRAGEGLDELRDATALESAAK